MYYMINGNGSYDYNKEFIKIILYVYYQVVIWLLKTLYVFNGNVLSDYRQWIILYYIM